MRINPPSKNVKGLEEGMLRTTMTHLEEGDVILVMTATADPLDYVKAAPTVAPKRAFWATVMSVAMSGIAVVTETGGQIIITDCAPQTAVTIRDRELSNVKVEDVPSVTITASVPGCPTCVMPLTDGHACPDFMLAARGEFLAEGLPMRGDAEAAVMGVDFSGTDFTLIAEAQAILDGIIANANTQHRTFCTWSTRGKVKRSRANRPRKAMLGSVSV